MTRFQLGPVAPPAGLQVVDFAADARLADDGQELVQRFQKRLPLAAQMGGEEAVVLGRGASQGDEFGRVGVAVGGVDERRRQADRALGHRLPHQRLHARQLFAVRPPVGEAQHVGPHPTRADE
jgi:hypothetical protein